MSMMPNIPWPAPNCGRSVKVKHANTGKEITVKVIDACRCCNSCEDYEGVMIDLSEGAFKAINNGDTGVGRIPVTWYAFFRNIRSTTNTDHRDFV